MTVLSRLRVRDIRFPTSESLDGSDALNKAPDYSAAYVELETSDGSTGYGLVFTTGRGTEVQVAAIGALENLMSGIELEHLEESPGHLYRVLTSDSQLRWLGPEKGVMHMAIGAVVNAGWDLLARRAGKPMWQFLLDLDIEQLVNAVDFTYLSDVLPSELAREILEARLETRPQRQAAFLVDGHPAYTTSAGWLGYDDEKVARLAGQAALEGFRLLKLKVGLDVEDDLRRLSVARSAVPDDVAIALDANQVWDVPEAIEAMGRFAEADPYWIEEPTSPDDVLGHAAIRSAISPILVATGEHAANRVMFKQFLAAGAIDVLQLDATRVGGMNEHLAILLLAAASNVRVVPHAGGVGLCEIVQHLAMFNSIAVAPSFDDRLIEYVDHLHEHFTAPVRIEGGSYQAPEEPGYGAQLRESSISRFEFPTGSHWATTRRGHVG